MKVDKTLDEVSAGDYDAVVLPGGQINPDLLRVEPKALKFIKDLFDAKKVVAAVCHAPWLLIETGIAKGRRMTSFKSIKTDVANAGAKWEDSTGRRRPGRHHVAQSGRSRSLQRQDHQRDGGRLSHPAQRGLTVMTSTKIRTPLQVSGGASMEKLKKFGGTAAWSVPASRPNSLRSTCS